MSRPKSVRAKSGLKPRIGTTPSSYLESVVENYDREPGSLALGPNASADHYKGRCSEGIYARALTFDLEAYDATAHASLSGPGVAAGIHSTQIPGTDIPINTVAYANAEIVRAEAAFGGVKAGVGLNANTGASVGVDGVSVSVLGFGVTLGPTMGIKTPVADVSATCAIM